jgi:hypothetical protein
MECRIEWDILGRCKTTSRVDYEKEVAKKAAKLTGKRKSTTTTVETGVVTTSTKKAKTGKASKEEAEELIQRINAVVMLNTNAVLTLVLRWLPKSRLSYSVMV